MSSPPAQGVGRVGSRSGSATDDPRQRPALPPLPAHHHETHPRPGVRRTRGSADRRVCRPGRLRDPLHHDEAEGGADVTAMHVLVWAFVLLAVDLIALFVVLGRRTASPWRPGGVENREDQTYEITVPGRHRL